MQPAQPALSQPPLLIEKTLNNVCLKDTLKPEKMLLTEKYLMQNHRTKERVVFTILPSLLRK
jgi:hypothetical protein